MWALQLHSCSTSFTCIHLGVELVFQEKKKMTHNSSTQLAESLDSFAQKVAPSNTKWLIWFIMGTFVKIITQLFEKQVHY